MNLVIDVGNSFVKLAVFKGKNLKHKEFVEIGSILEQIQALNKKFSSINKAILSSVGILSEKDLSFIKKRFDVLVLSAETKLPFINLYKTPQTLGVDRIALVSASVNSFSDKNVLIIDAGTCITYDFITNDNEYLGGAISPGLAVRYKSLNNLTANLPLLELCIPEKLIGDTTNNSIHSGVVYGVLNEIEGAIQRYSDKYSDLTIILTGGDANFLSKQLKSSIFANSNFLLEGLNFILQFNTNE